jgi:hypothetical protein
LDNKVLSKIGVIHDIEAYWEPTNVMILNTKFKVPFLTIAGKKEARPLLYGA